jgi:hypothetical protein
MNKDRRKDVASVSEDRKHDWRAIHQSWLFWVGFCLFLAAITIYLWSDDLSWHPRLH